MPSAAERPLFIEELLWKPPENEAGPTWDGYRNFWLATDAPGGKHFRQTAGINEVARPKTGKRRPAVAIFLTPAGERHRLPWLDEVDLDAGFIRYFGDNKPDSRQRAEDARGNRVLLQEMDLFVSDRQEDRELAAPLLFFRNKGSSSGKPITEFLGFGVIREAHRVTQIYRGRSFTNYAFDCVLFKGDECHDGEEAIDMRWIDDRRDDAIADPEANKRAPRSWRSWIRKGASSVDTRSVRRYVLRHDIVGYDDQVPQEDSSLGKVLRAVYDRYKNHDQHGFQALAAVATKRVLLESGLAFVDGWITPGGPDGGVDFVQRLDIGKGFSTAKLVVLGQAKCKKPWPRGGGTTAEDIARVVARLHRGWIGAYVTTSFYTDAAQRELVVDEYPVVLIHGRQLAETVEETRVALGFSTIAEVLDWADEVYERLTLSARPRPGDIIREWSGDPSIPMTRDVLDDASRSRHSPS